MAESGWFQWSIILSSTAFSLSLVVIAQTATSYWAAYKVAPQEIATFIDTVDFSIEENESYDRDVGKVQRLEDKIRLNRLLREIQKNGDDLREDLNRLVLEEGTTTMKTTTRLLWASKRALLEDRVRRLDLLRMRFMVVYLGIITSIADKQPPPPPPLPRELDKPLPFARPPPRKTYVEDPSKRTPVRRLTTQAIGHNEHVATPQKTGWAGVVQELQTSPRMQQRHASIEQAMANTSP